ncbi:branched-chain amino acid ABC transporter permease [Spiractinospora alimapuensis]|uniref:branched-chain amino acid ABC transporter permease n=1 Tax=Spiractinospora alimapuensis TaxID=2820884 RepID=UPI001F3E6326|nr:branched-chain amino acid ABC transporter permease [Spiractinospora alimapuensis]QVQ52855.1 branched-chain amino acid ABC transporter permease [Spiractinospora alimapuensis]
MTNFLMFLINGIAVGCGFALVGSGLVAVYRITGVVNFAQGMFAVVAALTATSLLGLGIWHGPAEILAITVAGCVGLLTGLVALGKPGTPALTALLVTLAVGFLAYAVEVLIWGDHPRSMPGLEGRTVLLGVPLQRQYLLVIAITLIVFVVLSLLFSRTYTGKALTACADNPYAARVIGINVRRMGFLAFALGGTLGGVAGVLIAPLRPISFDSDIALIVGGFAAAIFGGLTRPSLALLGGVLLGITEVMIRAYGNASYATLGSLVFLITIMIWQAARRPTMHKEAA